MFVWWCSAHRANWGIARSTHTNSRGRGGDGTTTPTHCLFAGWEVAAQGLLLFGSIPCFYDK